MTNEEALEILNYTSITISTSSKTIVEQYHQMLHIAEEALEKQIPKKVNDVLCNKKQKGGYCPTCGGTVVIENSFLRRIKENHCSWCGQALLWESDIE